jgi:hypothetical protein
MNRFTKGSLLAGTIMAGAMIATPAHAQDNEEAAASEENRIVVTGSRIQQRIDLTKQAQQFEFQAFEQEQNQRRAQQQQALTEAGDALKQLRDLIYFSQIDLNGVGSEALRGIANGIIDQTDALSAVLTQALDEVMAQARAALGIASPSRVAAMLIGAPLADGIGAGFVERVPAVAAQLSAQLQAIVQPVASAASIINQQMISNNAPVYAPSYSIDARGAAPGVGGEITRAIKTVQQQTGARADVFRRMA